VSATNIEVANLVSVGQSKSEHMSSADFRIVERLLDHREADDHFLVKWTGRPTSEHSWEPKASIPDEPVAAWSLAILMGGGGPSPRGTRCAKPPPLPMRDVQSGNSVHNSHTSGDSSSGRDVASADGGRSCDGAVNNKFVSSHFSFLSLSFPEKSRIS
jgi:hypothetical protein